MINTRFVVSFLLFYTKLVFILFHLTAGILNPGIFFMPTHQRGENF